MQYVMIFNPANATVAISGNANGSLSIFLEMHWRINYLTCSATIIFVSALFLLRPWISFFDKSRFFAIASKASTFFLGGESPSYLMNPPMMAKNPCTWVHPKAANRFNQVVFLCKSFLNTFVSLRDLLSSDRRPDLGAKALQRW